MSTNSTISIQLEDGTIKTCYCHWNGYPASNGVMLLANYQNPEKIKELISLGDISILESKIEPTGIHTFNKAEQGVCLFYGRDRQEKDIEAKQYKNFSEYSNNANLQEYDYIYIEKKKKWYLYDDEKKTLKPLHGIVMSIYKKYGVSNNKMLEQYLTEIETIKNYKKLNKTLTIKTEKNKYKI